MSRQSGSRRQNKKKERERGEKKKEKKKIRMETSSSSSILCSSSLRPPNLRRRTLEFLIHSSLVSPNPHPSSFYIIPFSSSPNYKTQNPNFLNNCRSSACNRSSSTPRSPSSPIDSFQLSKGPSLYSIPPLLLLFFLINTFSLNSPQYCNKIS